MPHPSLPYRRLAVVGAGGAHRSEDAWTRAARSLGLEAEVFDVLRWTRRLGALARPWLERSIRSFEPDFILFTRHASRLGEPVLRRITAGTDSAVWFLDAAPHPGLLELARLSGTLYLTYAAQVADYRNQGVPAVRFLPQGVDPERDRPASRIREEDRCEVSFIGSGQYPYRWPILERIAGMSRLHVRGPGWDKAPPTIPVVGGPVHGERFAEVVGAAGISLGASAVAEQDRDFASASNRMWKIFGCRGVYLGQHVPGIEQFARDGEHCRWYHDIDDAVEKVRDLLADPAGANAMAERGHHHALTHHSYASRLALLLAGQEYPLVSG